MAVRNESRSRGAETGGEVVLFEDDLVVGVLNVGEIEDGLGDNELGGRSVDL